MPILSVQAVYHPASAASTPAYGGKGGDPDAHAPGHGFREQDRYENAENPSLHDLLFACRAEQ